ncbi:MAG: hypothetical protein ABI609_06080 [Acidobacteriota bacterium]
MRDRAGWRWFLSLVVLFAVTLPRPSRAEDVFLKNGRILRGVMASRAGGMVRIQMPGGDLSLADRAVLRIESSDSAYRAYLTRREAVKKAGAKAADWLELARWARGAGQEQAALEAALLAAGLDAETPGLGALLGQLGYVFDAGSKSYLSFDEAMARSGRVLYEGAWISSSERDARAATYRREVAERDAVAQAAAERREQLEQRRRAAAQAPADEYASTNGIPLQYAYGYGGGYNGYNAYNGYGGAVLPGMVPRFPQRPCTFCMPPQKPQPTPFVQTPVPQPRPVTAAPAPSSATRTYAAPRPSASPHP